ncbi:hypothetical protein AC249_AIPGENE14869 [Exaiptasia diaphana]|nr:hypothetical protein AC249_AIPGENE14869 [Exaiptasia diaphana]
MIKALTAMKLRRRRIQVQYSWEIPSSNTSMKTNSQGNRKLYHIATLELPLRSSAKQAKELIKEKPNKIIINCGTNNLKKEKSKKTKTKLTRLVQDIRSISPKTTIALSSITHRSDDQSLHGKLNQNSSLYSNYTVGPNQ